MSEFETHGMNATLEHQAQRLEQLEQRFAQPFSLRNSFRGDPEGFIEDVVGEVKAARAKVLEAASIGRVFVTNYQSALAKYRRKQEAYDKLCAVTEELHNSIQELQRESFQKGTKMEYLTGEISELENYIKRLNLENEKLQRQVGQLRNEKNRLEEEMQLKHTNRTLFNQKKKEEDEALQTHIEELNIEVRKRGEEIQHLKFKIREIESLHQIDKNAVDKLRHTNTQLKGEVKTGKQTQEDLQSKLLMTESLVKKYETDLNSLKTYYEGVIRDLEKAQASRRNSISRLDPIKINEEEMDSRRQSAENLGDFLEEDIDSPQENMFFLLSSPKADFRQFQDFGRPLLMMDYLEPLSIPGQVPTLTCSESSKLTIYPQLNLTPKNEIPEFHTETLESVTLHAKPGKSLPLLVIEQVAAIGMTSQALDNFSDGESIGSDENSICSSKSTKDTLESRDPIMDFFVLTCQAAKLNSSHRDFLGRIPMNKLYSKVLEEAIPFNKWHDWVQNYLHARLHRRARK